MTEPLVFELGRPGRMAGAQVPRTDVQTGLPEALLRRSAPLLPEVSELDVVRHYTRLSQRNFSIDTQFYPLGSCTMKYNPRGCNTLAMLPGFLHRHPLADEAVSQGFLACLFELQEMLSSVTGMSGFSLTPMAGAQGELAGVAMMRAYHLDRGDVGRTEVLVPDAAHGTPTPFRCRIRMQRGRHPCSLFPSPGPLAYIGSGATRPERSRRRKGPGAAVRPPVSNGAPTCGECRCRS